MPPIWEAPPSGPATRIPEALYMDEGAGWSRIGDGFSEVDGAEWFFAIESGE